MLLGRRTLRAFVVVLVLGLVGVMVPGVAGASIGLGSVVSENPANHTPHVVSGAVHKFVQIGSVMYAGGSFTSVRTAPGVTPSGTFTRNNIVAFDATTGVITSFSPNINGTVWALATDGASLYVGGSFSSVNGVSRRVWQSWTRPQARSTRRSTPTSTAMSWTASPWTAA